MRHTKDNCLAHHQIIADDCGLACANCGECKCGECCHRLTELTLKQAQWLPTLRHGQTDDLKIQSARNRVWFSRLGVEDGMPYNNQITVEGFIDGKWVTVQEYQAK